MYCIRQEDQIRETLVILFSIKIKQNIFEYILQIV